MTWRVLSLSILSISLLTPAWPAAFEFRGENESAWDLLDLKGDGQAAAAEDLSCPPGYGPQVLHLTGTTFLVLAKGAELPEGTLVALYKENDARDADADGVILFGAAYPQDIAEAHNTKQWQPHLWLEQDNDSGLQFRYATAAGEENTLCEKAGLGVVTDPWNRTNWIWQKVQVHEGRVRARFWPAHTAEPAEWHIEAVVDGPMGGRFGVKVNSGDVHLAYFAADREDIPVAAPVAYLHFPYQYATQTRAMPLTLFVHSPQEQSASVDLTVLRGDKAIGQHRFEAKLPAGPAEFPLTILSGGGTPEGAGEVVRVGSIPSEGRIRVAVASSDGQWSGERLIEIKPAPQLDEGMARLEEAAGHLRDALGKARGDAQKLAALRVICGAAEAHTARARDLLAEARPEEAERAMGFAREALAELSGYKGLWLKELSPGVKISSFPEVPDAAKEGGTEAISYVYSPAYLIRFGEPELSAQSMAMGRSYEVMVPWTVEGASPDRDFAFNIRLISPLGNRVVAASDTAPSVPTSAWKPGQTYRHTVRLDVLPEVPNPDGPPQSEPPVLDETHYLVVSVVDPKTGGRLLLGNEPGPQPEPVGASFLLAKVYVPNAPLDIRQYEGHDGVALGTRTERMLVENLSDTAQEVDAVFTAVSDTGRVVHQQHQPLTLAPNQAQPLEFSWTPAVAGRLTMRFRLMRGATPFTGPGPAICLTELERTVTIAPSAGRSIRIAKRNHIERQEDRFVTPVTVSIEPAPSRPYVVEVRAGEALVGSASGGDADLVVHAQPWFGYYDVSVLFDDFRYDMRLIATVVETEGADLLVNGEPFIIKGVNVHGMDPGSPERTASMMRIMRDLGFNAWRGDFPARWQVDLAYELNTFYTVLAPFSCAGTDAIFARQDGPPMATARELSRVFAQRYVDSAGVLLWNSCNEIGGATADFLLSQYPVYKAHDPEQRPVWYANLYGQDFPQGQDVMGVNYYFGKGQRATDRQPMILRSRDVARAHAQPLIYGEFNSFIGAVHSSGVEAMRDLFAWGVAEGMAGGFQYMKGNSDRHPGVIDGGFNTHRIYDDAIEDALADARVEFVEANREALTLRVVNKRRFTLRDLEFAVSVSGTALEPFIPMADLGPEGTIEMRIPLPGEVAGPALSIEGRLRFVTHFGVRCSVPMALIGSM